MTVVPWPPSTPPHRDNGTISADVHPGDHNTAADALDTLIDRVGRDPSWLALPLGPGWTVQAGYQTAGYRRMGDRVELRGNLNQAATSNTIVATLPAGFRPPVNYLLYVFGYTTSLGNVVMRLDVRSDGNLQVAGGYVDPILNISIDVLSFSLTP